MPVDAAVARFEKRRHLFFHHVAHRARGGIGHLQLFRPMVARGGNEGQVGSVRRPLHISPFASARQIVTQSRAMLVGRHLQPDHFGGIHIDDHTLDRGDDMVARQRVFPGAQGRMAHLGLHQVHFTHAPLVLLKGCDLARIGRPQHNRAVAARPAGIVGGISEVFHAVGGQLRLFIGGHVAHPKIVIANQHGALFVGRKRFVASPAAAATPAPAASSTPSSAASRRGRRTDIGALVALRVALVMPRRCN